MCGLVEFDDGVMVTITVLTPATDGDGTARLRTSDGIGTNDRLARRARRDHQRQPNRGDCRRLPAAEMARRDAQWIKVARCEAAPRIMSASCALT